MARREARAVLCFKVALILILLGAAALVAALVFRYMHNDEVDEFHESFEEYSQQIIDTVHINAQHKLEAIGTLALQLQAYAINQNLTWPFVTIPFFEEMIMSSKSLIDANAVLLFPIVSNENRAKWEDYSVAHRGWINASYAAQRHVYGIDGLESEYGTVGPNDDWFYVFWGDDYIIKEDGKYNPPDYSSGIANAIFRTRDYDDSSKYNIQRDARDGPYFPQWQTAPMKVRRPELSAVKKAPMMDNQSESQRCFVDLFFTVVLSKYRQLELWKL